MSQISRADSGATTPSQSGSGSNVNEEVQFISQISMPGASLLDGLRSYPCHSLGVSYSSAEMQTVYSTVPPPVDWAHFRLCEL